MGKRVRYEHVSCEQLKGEEWRPVVGYEGVYEVSSFGRIKRVQGGPGAQAGKILRQAFSGRNYLYVMLCPNGKESKKRFRVHRLVAAAFLGPEPEGMQVNHKDGDKTNNRAKNLEYMTPLANTHHYHANNPQPTCKLNPDIVREIRNSDASAMDLSAKYGVGLTAIYKVRSGQSWKRVV